MFSVLKPESAAKMDFVIQFKSDGNGERRRVFSSGDEVVGEVVITTSEEVLISDIDISFVGAFSR